MVVLLVDSWAEKTVDLTVALKVANLVAMMAAMKVEHWAESWVVASVGYSVEQWAGNSADWKAAMTVHLSVVRSAAHSVV